MTEAPRRPELAALAIADPPERWRALGFAVADSRLRLGSIDVELGLPGAGIVAWELRGAESGVDGLVGLGSAPDASDVEPLHPNGAVGIDHVVIATPDFDRTAAALEDAGLGFRRVRDAGGFRQGFRRLGPAIMEVVEARGGDRPAGDAAATDAQATDAQPSRFWGLVVVVENLEALADRLGEHLGAVKPAVQPGRRIATLRESAGLSTKLAFMDPE